MQNEGKNKKEKIKKYRRDNRHLPMITYDTTPPLLYQDIMLYIILYRNRNIYNVYHMLNEQLYEEYNVN